MVAPQNRWDHVHVPLMAWHAVSTRPHAARELGPVATHAQPRRSACFILSSMHRAHTQLPAHHGTRAPLNPLLPKSVQIGALNRE